jgi:hypothetical protein
MHDRGCSIAKWVHRSRDIENADDKQKHAGSAHPDDGIGLLQVQQCAHLLRKKEARNYKKHVNDDTKPDNTAKPLSPIIHFS